MQRFCQFSFTTEDSSSANLYRKGRRTQWSKNLVKWEGVHRKGCRVLAVVALPYPRFSTHPSSFLLLYGHRETQNRITSRKGKILPISTVSGGSGAVAASGRPPSPVSGSSTPAKAGATI